VPRALPVGIYFGKYLDDLPRLVLMTEARGITEKTERAAEPKPGESEYSAPVRVLRRFVTSFFKVIEGIIRLFSLIYCGLKTIVTLVFRFFWPYPIYYRRHK